MKYLITNSNNNNRTKMINNKKKMNSTESSNSKPKNHKDKKKYTYYINKLLKYQRRILNIFIIKLYNLIMSPMHISKGSPVDSLKYIISVVRIIAHYSTVKIKEAVLELITIFLLPNKWIKTTLLISVLSYNKIGKLRGNAAGSTYYLYDDGVQPKNQLNRSDWRVSMAAIEYESNFMGMNGPRKIKVTIPSAKLL